MSELRQVYHKNDAAGRLTHRSADIMHFVERRRIVRLFSKAVSSFMIAKLLVITVRALNSARKSTIGKTVLPAPRIKESPSLIIEAAMSRSL